MSVITGGWLLAARSTKIHFGCSGLSTNHCFIINSAIPGRSSIAYGKILLRIRHKHDTIRTAQGQLIRTLKRDGVYYQGHRGTRVISRKGIYLECADEDAAGFVKLDELADKAVITSLWLIKPYCDSTYRNQSHPLEKLSCIKSDPTCDKTRSFHLN